MAVVVVLGLLSVGLIATPAAAQDPVGAAVHGQVLADDTGQALAGACVYVDTTTGGSYYNTVTDQDGRWSIDVAPDTYNIEFIPECGGSSHVGEWYDDVSRDDIDQGTAPTPVVVDDQSVQVDASMAPRGEGSIEGVVVSGRDNQPLDQVCVTAYDFSGVVASTSTDSSGSYSFQGVPEGNYLIRFVDCLDRQHVSANYEAPAPAPEAAGGFAGIAPPPQSPEDPWGDPYTLVEVVGSQTTSGIGATLLPGNVLDGTVRSDTNGDGLGGICVEMEGPDRIRTSTTDDLGYWFRVVPEGDHTVHFAVCDPSDPHVGEYYDDVSHEAFAGGTPPTVLDLRNPVYIEAGLAMGDEASLSGRVTDTDGYPIGGVCVEGFGDAGAYLSTVTDTAGAYSAVAEPDTYALRFDPCGLPYQTEWFDDQPDEGSATPIEVAPGTFNDGYDAVLSDAPAPQTGISGTVTSSSDQPLRDICVEAHPDHYASGVTAVSDDNGHYEIAPLAPGTHYVSFRDCGGHGVADQYYDGVGDFSDATPVNVTNGAMATADAVMYQPGAIGGTVKDPDGSPIADVCVDLRGPSGDGFDVTDDQGMFFVGGLTPGDYVVELYGCGADVVGEFWEDSPSRATATPVTVVEGATTTIDPRMSGGGSISGVVTDDQGQPVEGVCVSANGNHGWGYAQTDPTGAYQITGLNADDYVVEFQPCDADVVGEYYDDATTWDRATPVAVANDQIVTGVDAVLATAGAIEGRVTRPNGDPIDDVCVRATVGDWHAWGNSVSDGTYRVNGLPAGDATVRFTGCGLDVMPEYYDDKPTEAEADPVAVVAGQTTSAINAVLSTGGRISGTVTDQSNNPLAGICVYASSDDHYGNDSTNPDGTYEIVGLAGGDYRVDFDDCAGDGFVSEYYDDATDYDDATLVTVIIDEETSGIDAQLALGGRISGTVTTDDGNPAAGVCASAHTPDYSVFTSGYQSDSQGHYEIRGIAAGTYVVDFYDCGENDWIGGYYPAADDIDQASRIDIVEGAVVSGIDFVMAQGGRITGRVTRGDTGQVPDEFCVTAHDLGRNHRVTHYFDRNAGYAVNSLAPGDYTASASGCHDGDLVPEFYDGVMDESDAEILTVTAGGAVSGIDFELDPGATISGRVTDESGDPLAGVCVWARLDGGSESQLGRTASDGTYEIAGLRGGDYRVSFVDCGDRGLIREYYDDTFFFSQATLVGVAAGADVAGVDAELAVGGTITGVVVDEDDNPMGEGYQVSAYLNGSYGAYGDTAADGSFEVSGLPTGDFQLRLTVAGTSRVIEWYEDAISVDTATDVPVVSPDTTSGIRFVIDPGDIPPFGTPRATLTADPSQGAAPLQTELTAHVADDQGGPLDYTLSFGDGSTPETGTITPPYPTVQTTHTYGSRGVYTASIAFTDEDGNVGSASTTVDAGNRAPTAGLSADTTQGPAPLDVEFFVSGSDPDGDQLIYSLDPGDGSAPLTGALPDGSVSHTYANAGTYTATLTVSDGDLDDTATETVTVLVPTTTTVAVSPSPSVHGREVTITASVSSGADPGPTGDVAFSVDGQFVATVPVSGDGSAQLTTTLSGAGQRNVGADYAGDATHAASRDAVTHTVDKAPVVATLDLSPNPADPGDAITATITLSPPTATGTVQLSDGGPLDEATVVGGGAVITLDNGLPPGSHDLFATYGGDANHLDATSATVTQVVRHPSSVTVTTTPAPSVTGQSVTIDVTVATDAPGVVPDGRVTVRADGTLLGAPELDVNGQASVQTTALAVPGAQITATYDGSDTLADSTGAVDHTVGAAATTTTLSTVTSPTDPGEDVIAQVAVDVVAPGGGQPEGVVTITEEGTPRGTATLTNGTAEVNLGSLPPGPHDLTATYEGTADHNASTSSAHTHTVRYPTTVVLTTTPAQPVSGQEVTITVEATSPGGTPTGPVSIRADGNALGSPELDGNGQATVTTTFSAGPHQLRADYAGDQTHAAGEGTAALTVAPAATTTTLVTDPSTTGPDDDVIATVQVTTDAPGSGEPTGEVTVTENGSPLGTATLAGGAATINLGPLPAGSHQLVAGYAGDADRLASDSAAVEHVVIAATTTQVVASPATPVVGEPVTLAFTVQGAGETPTGRVDVFIDGVDAGSVQLEDGTATMTRTFESAGSQQVIGAYAGDDRHDTSQGSADVDVQPAATSTTLQSTPNPSAPGETVTLTATVAVEAPGAGDPTGNVAFTDDGVPLGSAPLNGDTATLEVDALDVGDHPVVATYAGSADFAGSASAAVTQQVRERPTTTTLVADPSPSDPGETVTLTATVEAADGQAGAPTGSVTFLVDGADLATVPLDGGSAETTVDLDVSGDHALVARFTSTNGFSDSEGTASHLVRFAATVAVTADPSPSHAGDEVQLRAVVTGDGPDTPTGTVSFSADGQDLGSATLTDGEAVLTTTGLPVGDDVEVTAAYAGDAAHVAANGTTQTDVQPVSTTTTLTGPTRSAPGEDVDVTVAVSVVENASVAEGAVRVLVDGVERASGSLTGGSVTLTVSGMAEGDRSVVAEFVGDPTYAASTSDPLSHRVTATPLTAGLSADRPGGTAPETVTLTPSAEHGVGTLNYSLDFGDGTAVAEGVLPALPIAHDYTGAGTFQAVLTVSDGVERDTAAVQVVVVPDEPLIAEAGDPVVVGVGQTVTFDGGGSRPPVAIADYGWDFGDGASGTGASATHTFAAAGDHTVTLTVTDHDGATATDTTPVRVVPVNDDGQLAALDVLVTDLAGAPVEGAGVLVFTGPGDRHTAVAGPDGHALLAGLPDGEYTVYAEATSQGFRPGLATGVTVVDGTGEATVELEQGAIAEAEMETRRLTAEEAAEAGIDLNDPDNQWTEYIDLYLNVEGFPGSWFRFRGIGGRGGIHSGGIWTPWGHIPCQLGRTCSAPYAAGGQGRGTFRIDPCGPGREQLCATYMVIPFKVSFLKEFFEVRMAVVNLSDPAFTLADASASLPLPSGLTLAPTASGQQATQSLGDIPGGGVAEAVWLLRGDAEGFYDLTATASATLQPFDQPFTLTATTDEPLRVWGDSAIEMIAEVDRYVIRNHPYRLRVGLKNVSDVPVYNPTVELLDNERRHNVIYQPLERMVQGASVVQAGETFWTDDFVMIPNVTGVVEDEHDNDRFPSFTRHVAGNANLDTDIVLRDPPFPPEDAPQVRAYTMQNKVGLDWDPQEGASAYRVFSTPDNDTSFPTDHEETQFITTTRAAVLNVDPADGNRLYAISSLVDGIWTTFHEVAVQGSSAVGTETMDADLIYLPGSHEPSCGEPRRFRVSYLETFAELATWSVSVEGVEYTGTMTGESAFVNPPAGYFEVAPPGDGSYTADVVINGTNSLGDEMFTVRRTVQLGCPVHNVVVLAAGLGSSFDGDSQNWRDTWGDFLGADGVLTVRKRYTDDVEGGQGTVFAYSYEGAVVGHETSTPSFTSNNYNVGSTWQEIFTGTGFGGDHEPRQFLEALMVFDYRYSLANPNERVQYHLVGHSLGGWSSAEIGRLAREFHEDCDSSGYRTITNRALQVDYPCERLKGLIGTILTVDGALRPGRILKNLGFYCKLNIDFAGGNHIGQTRTTERVERAAIQRAYLDGPRDNVLHSLTDTADFGTTIVTATNTVDGCLHTDVTLVSEDRANMHVYPFRVDAPSEEAHSSLLHPAPPQHGHGGFPLYGVMMTHIPRQDEGYLPPVPPAQFASVAMGALTGLMPATPGRSSAGQVEIYDGETLVHTTVADETGSWRAELPAGDYTVYIVPFGPGYGPAWYGGDSQANAQLLTVQPGEDVSLGLTTPVATHEASVVLRTTAGDLVPHGVVDALDNAGQLVASGFDDDGDGVVTLEGLPAGSLHLVAAAWPNLLGEGDVDAAVTSETTVTLEPSGGAALTHRVIQDDGSPVVGARVTIRVNGEVVAVRLTDEEGHAWFAELASGDVEVVVDDGAAEAVEIPARFSPEVAQATVSEAEPTVTETTVVANEDSGGGDPGGGGGGDPGGGSGSGGGEVLPPAGEPVVSLGDVSASEPDGAVEVQVALDQPADGDVRVSLATADGSAVAGEDYVATAADVTIPAGETAGTFSVELIDDDIEEDDEAFTVTITSVDGAAIGDGEATITIVDDEAALGTAEDRMVQIDVSGPVTSNSDVSVAFSTVRTPNATYAGDAVVEVLLASELVFADALASGALQGDRTLLLTHPDVLEEEVLTELQRLGATHVRILGGTAAVSDVVEDQLTEAGFEVVRTFGPTRLETAVAIAAEVGGDAGLLARAFAADGATDATQAFADSLAMGAWAASGGRQLLFSQTEVLSGSTASHLEQAGLSELMVAGGTAAISEDVVTQAGSFVGSIDRIAGASRFHTAVEIARARGFTSDVPASRVIIVEGQADQAWAAGFAAAGLAADMDAPVLLANADALPQPTVDFLANDFVAATDGTVIVCAASPAACAVAEEALAEPA